MVGKDILIKDWLVKQANKQVLEWEQAMQKFYPQYAKSWIKPEEHFRSLQEDWNFLDAVKYLDWEKLIAGQDLRVLDLGSGTGWLAAFLSRFANIEKIDALDSSRYNLTVMMPEIVRMMNGDIGKIDPVLGLFSPLPVENEYYDIIGSGDVAELVNFLENYADEDTLYQYMPKGGTIEEFAEYLVNNT